MKTINETQSISTRDRALLEQIKTVVHGFLPEATVILYGSVARGTQRADSDYDILVLSEKRLTCPEEDAIWDALYEIQLEEEVLISTIFIARSDWDTPLHSAMPFHQEVERDSVLL